jgi:filamentous hemagglutinin family protein
MKTQPKLLAKLMCLAVLHSSVVLPMQAIAQVATPVATQISPNPASGSTKVYTAPTGVSVVDINTANAAGVSHNKFDQFNVGDKGVVLNNGNTSQLMRNSQLAGQVFSNFNLGNEATLILNEVVSPNRSLLAGYIEVLGGRADLVLANPWGITCSGCGFINTPRVTLTTGTPNLGADGSLQGFRVNRGDILINGLGVEARNQAVFDVLARSVKIDGQINGQDVRIVSGNNDHGYAARSVTPLAAGAGGEGVPVFAIDSTALGGMYANRIQLVATEAGVGVRMLGEVAASADDFKLDVAGKVQLQNRASAQRDIGINASGGIEMLGANSTLAAGRDLKLVASAGEIKLAGGNLKADGVLDLTALALQDQGVAGASRFASGNLNMSIGGALNMGGVVWGSGGKFDASAGSFTLGDAHLYSGANTQAGERGLSLLGSGQINLDNVQILSPANLRIASGNGAVLSNNNALLQAGGNLAASASNDLVMQGRWEVIGNVNLDAAAGASALQVSNGAHVQAGGVLQVGATGAGAPAVRLVNNAAMLGDSVQINADVINHGILQGKNGVQISSSFIDNLADGGILSTGNAKALQLQTGHLQNLGQIQSAGTLAVRTAGNLDNGGNLATTGLPDGGSAGLLQIDSAAINNSGVIAGAGQLAATVAGKLANSGSVQSAAAMDLVLGGALDNSSASAKLRSGGALNVAVLNNATNNATTNATTNVVTLKNNGQIQALGALNLGSSSAAIGTITNAAGAALLGDSLNAFANAISNDGILQGSQGVQVTSSGALVNGAAGAVLTTVAGNNLNLNLASLDNAGLVQAAGAMQLTVGNGFDNRFVNRGTIATLSTANGGNDGALTLQAGSIDNGGKLLVAGAAKVTALAGALSNSGSMQVAGDLALASASKLDNSGANSNIVAGGRLAVGAANAGQSAITIQNDGRMQAGGVLELGNDKVAVSTLGNSVGAVLLGDSLSFSGGQIDNAGLLQGSNGMLVAASGAINNRASGSVLSVKPGKDLQITAASLDNAGLLQSGGAMRTSINGAFANSGTVLTLDAAALGSGGPLLTQAGSINNSGLWSSGGTGSLTSSSAAMVNSGTVQSMGDLTLNTASSIANNGADSKIFSNGSLLLTSSQSGFTVSNDGLIQAKHDLQLGEVGHALTRLTNSASAKIVADTLSISGDTLSNPGLMQGGSRLQIDLSGKLTNAGTLLTTGAGSVLDLKADSLSNSGSVQSGGKLFANTVNATFNSGAMLTTALEEGGSSGSLIMTGSELNNSGSIASAGNALFSATGGNIVNSGLLQAAGDQTVAAALGLSNIGTNSVIYGAGNVDLTSNNASSFTLSNQGTIQSGKVLSVGSNAHVASTVGNAASGQMLGDTLAMVAGSVTNAGWLQGNNGVTIHASGALNNSGNLLSSIATRDVALTVASFSNSGTVQSAGDLTLQSAGAANNSGTLLTKDAAGNMLLQASSINNGGTVQAANSANLLANAGSIDNSGSMAANGVFNGTVATAFNNTGAGSKIVGNGAINLATGAGSFNFSNDGGISALAGLTIGSNAKPASSFGNSASGVLLGDTVAIHAGGLTNGGTIQGANDVAIIASGALSNNGNILSTLATKDVAINAGSLANGGIIQSAGDLTIQSAGAAGNSGSLIAKDAAGNLSLTASAINNSGFVQAANSASLNAGSAALDNSGTIATSGNLTISVASALNNLAAGSIIYSDGDLSFSTPSASFGFTNNGKIGAAKTVGVGSNANPVAAMQNNAGALLSGDSLAIETASLTNAGTLQGNRGVTVNASAAINNSGNLLTTVAGQNIHLNADSFSNGNSGIVQSSGSLSVQTLGAIANSGSILTQDNAGNMSLAGSTINNSGFIQAANSASLSAASSTIDNSATIEAGGNLTLSVATAFNNAGGGAKLVSDGNINFTTNGSSFSLDNDGGIQSLQTLTLGSNAKPVSNLTNQATGSMLAANLQATATSLTNAGTMQGETALGLTVSGALVNSGKLLAASSTTPLAPVTRDISLNVGSFNNGGTVQAASNLSITASGSLSNDGTLLTQDSTGALTLAAAGISNSGMLQAGNSASLSSLGALDNSGTVHSMGAMQATVATTLTNTSGAKLISDDNLTISSSNAGFTLTNAAIVQATGALAVGDASHRATLNNQSGAKLAGNSLSLYGNALDNSGRIQALAGTTVNAASFSNHGASAVFLAAADSSASSMTLSGALNNEGAIHGSGNFNINAASIANSDTAGISSLANLTLASSGNISNAGALYAGAQLNATAAGTFTNSATLAAPQGTLDSGGSISVTANTFVNNRSINASGNITISATTLRNEVPGGDTREWYRYFTGSDNRDSTNSYYNFPDNYEEQYWSKSWTERQRFAGGTPAFKPQIISSGTLTLQNFNSASNLGGVISAPTVTLVGNGGATFNNNDLALQQRDYRQQWEIYTHWIALGPATYDDHVRRNDNGGVLQSTSTISTIGAGIFAGTLNAGGFTLNNLGSPFAANPNATSASASGASSAGSVGSVGAAGAINPGSGGSASAAGGISAGNASGTSAAGAINANNVSGSSASAGVGAGSVTRASGTAGAGITDVSASSGAAAVALTNANKNNGVAGVAATNVIRLPGLAGNTVLINLPSNPNGFFVSVKDPNSQFLVQANPLFQVGTNTVGSDYLAQRLGFDTNTLEKRLGDSNYEAYLVRQQLIAQTGSNVLKGYRNEAAQIQAMMDQAVTQSGALGLQFGQPPTADQLSHLTRDIVWMVDQEVAGQHVLVPMVYLAPATRDGIVSGAVIAADDLNFDGDALNNTGGTISAKNNLNVKTKGDISNLSGTITGGNVSLKSTAGNIVNQTVAQTDGSKFDAATTIGKTAGIVATKNLTLDAAKDIVIKGADVKAAGNANINAGGNVVLDTIENRTSSSSFTSSGDGGLLGGSSTRTQSGSTSNIGSRLDVGGNLSLNAGKAATIAGSSVNVAGDLDLKAKDGVNILARQDTVDTKTTSRTAGAGVGGGLFGSEKTTKDEFEGKNKAASLKVGGNANIKTDGNLVLEGSDLKVAGNANLDANDILVLAGKDEKRSTTVTETTAILTGANASSKSGTKVDPGSASADEKSRTAKAGVSAEATASAEAEVKLFSVKKDTTNTLDIKNRGSTIEVGKNLNLKAKNDVTLQGANVQAAGNIAVDAKNINILTAEDISQTTTSSEETSLKLSSSNNASASASAGVEANGVKLSAKAEAQARAKAATDNVVGVANVKTQSLDRSTTNQGSVLKAGGDMSLKAKETLTLKGSDIEAAGDVTQQAKDIKNLAAADTKLSLSNTETTVVGIYIAAEAQAGAKAEASAKVTGVGASAKADATAEAGTGLHISHEDSKSASGSSTAVVSTIKAGGNLTRIAENKITDVGTQIGVAGDLTQKAKEIESLAASNTEFSTSESDKHTVRVGVYGEAGASAGAEAKAGVGGVKAGANAEAHAVGGYKIGYTGNNSTESSASSTAVVGNIVVGGKLSSTSTGKTTLEATNIKVGGDTELSASAVDFKAVQDTSVSSKTSRDIDASLKVGAGVAASAGTEGGAKVGPQGEIKAGFDIDSKKGSSASSTAVTGSLNTGGNLKITTTQGDIRLQGVDVAAGKDVQLKSAGAVVLDAAQSTTASTTDNTKVGVQVGAKAGGGENSFNAALNVGVDKGNSSSNTAKVGSIKSGGNVAIDAAKDITLVGTTVDAAGDVGLKAGGNVNLKAVKNTVSDESTKVDFGVGVDASASGGSGNLDLDVALKDKKKLDSQAVAIKSGGKTNVVAKGDINQDGNVLAANQTQAGGKLNTTALETVNKDSDIRFGISVDVEAEKKKKKDADGKEIVEPAKPKDKVNRFLDSLMGFDKPAAKAVDKPLDATDSPPAVKKPVQVADAGDSAVNKPLQSDAERIKQRQIDAENAHIQRQGNKVGTAEPATDSPAASKKPLPPADAADTAAKKPVQSADAAVKAPQQSNADRIKQRQADAEIAHLKRQGKTVDAADIYKKWGLPPPDGSNAAPAKAGTPATSAKPGAADDAASAAKAAGKAQAGSSAATPKVGFEGKLGTKPDSAFFWSGPAPAADGSVNSDVTMNKARDYALASKGDTMETVMERNGVKMPKYGEGATQEERDASIKAWGDASAEYARNAKGSVKAVIGNARANGIWYTRELPTLLDNPKVNKITQIDAVTGQESVIFDRAKGILPTIPKPEPVPAPTPAPN